MNSKDLRIIFTRNSSWFIVESAVRKPDFFRDEFVSNKIAIEIVKNDFSNILPQIGSRDIACHLL